MSHAVARKGLAWFHVRKINSKAMDHHEINLPALWPGNMNQEPFSTTEVKSLNHINLNFMPRTTRGQFTSEAISRGSPPFPRRGSILIIGLAVSKVTNQDNLWTMLWTSYYEQVIHNYVTQNILFLKLNIIKCKLSPLLYYTHKWTRARRFVSAPIRTQDITRVFVTNNAICISIIYKYGQSRRITDNSFWSTERFSRASPARGHRVKITVHPL
jgi:hypothetical protein